ncbi:MAG: hypothetical protein SFW67_35820 [Myxococcaceae bacterium]|nr:hypothetical protein [Myxococcaceae bacterium]
MKRLALVTVLALACSPGATTEDAGRPTGPRLQACTIELTDFSSPWVLEPGQRVRLELELRAVRTCSETAVQPDDVALTLSDGDGVPLEFTSTWERRLQGVLVWLEFTVPATSSVRASATVEPGFGVVRWVWPVEPLRTLTWTNTARPAEGFLESDAGRAWYSRRGVQFETPSGEFSTGATFGLVLSPTTLWTVDPMAAMAWSPSTVRLPTNSSLRPSALGLVDGRLFVADGLRLVAYGLDGGRVEYRDAVAPDEVEALSGGERRVRLCRRGRVDELILPASWRRDPTPPVNLTLPCMSSDDGMWLVQSDVVTLVRPDGGRDVVRRPAGVPLSAPSLVLPSRAPALFVGVTVQRTGVVWVAVGGSDGGLEGRHVTVPLEATPLSFDGRRLFINDRAGRLSWAEP